MLVWNPFFSRVTIEQCQKKVCTKIKERKGGNQAIIIQGVKFAICPKLKSCEMATAANCSIFPTNEHFLENWCPEVVER